MKTIFILSIMVLSNVFIGTAENPHYITNSSNEGYYIEDNLDIHAGDTLAIIDNNVYIIDCNH